jgi:hypothetical protein
MFRKARSALRQDAPAEKRANTQTTRGTAYGLPNEVNERVRPPAGAVHRPSPQWVPISGPCRQPAISAMRHARNPEQGSGPRTARDAAPMNRFDGTRASTGAVWTPVGARVVAILSRSRWIVAQAAAGNTQAPTRDRRWADLLSLFENQKRVKRANSEKTEIFGKVAFL